MRDTILYVRNNEETNIINVLVRLFSGYRVDTFVYDKLKPIEAISNINTYTKKHNICVLIGSSFDAFLILNCNKDLAKCIINACFKPATYIKTQDWQNIEREFYLNYEQGKHKKVIAYYTLNDEVFGGSGYRILCTGFYKYVYRISCGHVLTYDAIWEHHTKLLKWVALNLH